MKNWEETEQKKKHPDGEFLVGRRNKRRNRQNSVICSIGKRDLRNGV